MGLQILSSVWGKHHVEMFENVLLKSFSGNEQALKGAKWNIFTDEEFSSYIERQVNAILPDTEVKIGSITDLRRYIDITQSAVIWQIEECLKSEDRLLIAPPDTFFGVGSIHGLLEIGSEKGSCVVVPHPRVLPSITPYLEPMRNPQLVSLAWEHLHRSWSDAEVGHPMQNSFVGGVAWKKLSKELYAVTHRLPTVYLADLTTEDLEYFKTTPSFGSFDHLWPGDILLKRGRQRFIGSSDACFIIEVTDPDKNVPPLWDGPPTEFWRKHFHNEMNKQISAIFRGE